MQQIGDSSGGIFAGAAMPRVNTAVAFSLLAAFGVSLALPYWNQGDKWARGVACAVTSSCTESQPESPAELSPALPGPHTITPTSPEMTETTPTVPVQTTRPTIAEWLHELKPVIEAVARFTRLWTLQYQDPSGRSLTIRGSSGRQRITHKVPAHARVTGQAVRTPAPPIS